MAGVLWGKLILNLNNALNALAGMPLAAGAGRPALAPAARRPDRGGAGRAEAAGVRPARVEGVPPRAIPFILRLPDLLFRLRGAAHAGDRSRRRAPRCGRICARAARPRSTTCRARSWRWRQGGRGGAHDRAHRAPREGGRARRAGSPGLQPRRSPGAVKDAERAPSCGRSRMDADAIVVGGGLAGLVAATELVEAGKRVILLDQEPRAVAGRAGVLVVRRAVLRRQPRAAAHAHPRQPRPRAAGLAGLGRLRPRRRTFGRASGPRPTSPSRPARSAPGCTPRACAGFPIVGWAERGGYTATEHGNSVPRFHVTWGTGPGVIEPFVERVREGEKRGLVSLRFRHRVNGLTTTAARSTACAAKSWSRARVERGAPSSRTVVGEFALKAQAIIVTSGGIGGNHELVRANWPERLGEPPRAHDLRRARSRRRPHARHHRGRRRRHHQPRPHVALHRGHHRTGARSGARHGIRILPGPSSLWFDARGRRLPVPLFPGFDTLGTLAHIMAPATTIPGSC